MKQQTHAVGIALYENNSILLVRHTALARLPTGSYGFPAGRVNEGESSLEAGVRELQEETGLITSPDYLSLLLQKISRMSMKEGIEEFMFTLYRCVHYAGQLRASEKTVPEFVPLSRLDDILLVSPDVKEIARGYQNTSYP